MGHLVGALLSDSDSFVVRSACEAAGRQRMKDLHDSVIRLLKVTEAATRIAALHALSELWQESDFTPVLHIFTVDPSVEVRKEAAWALRSKASTSNWRPLFDLWRADGLARHRQWACELATVHGDADLLPDVRNLTGDLNGHVRSRAAEAVRALETRGLARG